MAKISNSALPLRFQPFLSSTLIPCLFSSYSPRPLSTLPDSAPMLFQLTSREKRALGIIALLIALGLTGLWIL